MTEFNDFGDEIKKWAKRHYILIHGIFIVVFSPLKER